MFGGVGQLTGSSDLLFFTGSANSQRYSISRQVRYYQYDVSVPIEKNHGRSTVVPAGQAGTGTLHCTGTVVQYNTIPY